MKKTLVLATSIAVLAGIWTVIVSNVGSFGPIPFVLWPTFVAWATFFFLGGTVAGMRDGFVQLMTGVVLSGVLMAIYGAVVAADPLAIWLGIFVLVIAWLLTALSAFGSLWAAVPAGFCGAACYFGVSGLGKDPLTTSIATIIPLICGLLLGWLSAWLAEKVMPTPATTDA